MCSGVHRISATAGAIKLAEMFLELYIASPAYVELATPVHAALAQLHDATIAPSIRSVVSAAHARLVGAIEGHRKDRAPLRLQERKPISIRMYNPRFDERYAHHQPLFACTRIRCVLIIPCAE